MVRNLVLGGGGSYCAYQAGAVLGLAGEQGMDFDRVIGVSGGALNAVYLAQAPREPDSLAALVEQARGLCRLWAEDIQGNGDAYSRRCLGYAGLLLGHESVYELGPLRRLLREQINVEAIKASGRLGGVGTYDIASMRYIEWPPDAPEFLEMVVASASIPVAFPPVRAGDMVLVDGGLWENAPTRHAFDNAPDEIVMIAASTVALDDDGLPIVLPDEDAAPPIGIRAILAAAVAALCGAVLEGDLRGMVAANRRLVGPHGAGYGAATGKRPVALKILSPEPGALGAGSCLEFDPAAIARRIDYGLAQASRGAWLDLPADA